MKKAVLKSFWSWFRNNEEDLFRGLLRQDRQEAELERMTQILSTVDDSLSFELGAVLNDRRELVVTTNGVVEGFSVVAELLREQPELSWFTFTELRQRRAIANLELERLGKKLDVSQIFFTLTENRRLFDVTLYVENYEQKDNYTYLDLCYEFLDAAIGEFDVATKLNEVLVRPLVKPSTETSQSTILPFTRFAEIFDESVHLLVTALSKQSDDTRRETLLHRLLGLLPERIQTLRAESPDNEEKISIEFFFIAPSQTLAQSLVDELEESTTCIVFAETGNSVVGETHSVTCYVDLMPQELGDLANLVVHMSERAGLVKASLEDVSLTPVVQSCSSFVC